MSKKTIFIFISISAFLGFSASFMQNRRKSESKVLSAVPSTETSTEFQEVSTVLKPKISSFTELETYISSTNGQFAVHVKDLTTQQEYKINSDHSFYGASIYKILVAGAFYEALANDFLSFNYIYMYEPVDYCDGSGVLQNYKIGSSYSIGELLDYLLKYSDNIAQNILVRNIGVGKVADFYRKYYDFSESATFSSDLYITPEKVSNIFYNIYQKDSWSKELRREFFSRMTDTQFEDRIARTLLEELTFSHKIGSAPAVNSWHDCGIVFAEDFMRPTLVCLMSKNTTYEDFLDVSHVVGSFINSIY